MEMCTEVHALREHIEGEAILCPRRIQEVVLTGWGNQAVASRASLQMGNRDGKGTRLDGSLSFCQQKVFSSSGKGKDEGVYAEACVPRNALLAAVMLGVPVLADRNIH